MKEKEALELLRSLLELEGAGWTEERGFLRFRSKRDGMLWETACRARDGALVFYSRFPFTCREPDRVLRLCGEINRQLIRGAVFPGEDGSPVYRCLAELDDVYGAEERIMEALRYSAGVMARWWGPLAGA